MLGAGAPEWSWEEFLGARGKREHRRILWHASTQDLEMSENLLGCGARFQRKRALVLRDVEKMIEPLTVDGFQIHIRGDHCIKVPRLDDALPLQIVHADALHFFPEDFRIFEAEDLFLANIESIGEAGNIPHYAHGEPP